jgi:aminomethyltransferase
MPIDYHPDEFIGTPFNPCTALLNYQQRWVAWGRYHVVDVFTDRYSETRAIRQTAGLIDMSPLSKYLISGADATAFLDHIMTRDMTRVGIGQIVYSPWCNEHGKVVGDGMICRLAGDTYRLSADPNLAWLRHHSRDYDITLKVLTNEFAIAALQGPLARAILEAALGADCADLRFSRYRSIRLGSLDIDVLRQGFTGEFGYELWVAATDAVELWNRLMHAGQPLGMKPVGFNAHDIARVEAGLLIVGPDYTGAGIDSERGAAIAVDTSHHASPFELGLQAFVDFSKTDFIGKQALLNEQANGSRYQLVGLELPLANLMAHYQQLHLPPEIGAQAYWYPMTVTSQGRPVGRATSVTWAPTVSKLVGFGHLETTIVQQNSPLIVHWPLPDGFAGIAARIVPLPFIGLNRSSDAPG